MDKEIEERLDILTVQLTETIRILVATKLELKEILVFLSREIGYNKGIGDAHRLQMMEFRERIVMLEQRIVNVALLKGGNN